MKLLNIYFLSYFNHATHLFKKLFFQTDDPNLVAEISHSFYAMDTYIQFHIPKSPPFTHNYTFCYYVNVMAPMPSERLWHPTSVMQYHAIYISFIQYIANDPKGISCHLIRLLNWYKNPASIFVYSGGILAAFSDVPAPSNSHLLVEWTLIFPIFSSTTSPESRWFRNRSCQEYITIHRMWD